jgi:serine/threonine protein phosphatase PrpC
LNDWLILGSFFHIESFGISDVGLIRKSNEDVFRELPKEKFFVLADGMGGHNAGEVAALCAVEYMCSAVQNLFIQEQEGSAIDELESHLGSLIENTNLWIHHLGASDPTLHGMGTTLCSTLFFKESIIYSHVGDSRIYRVRDYELQQLTKDHTFSTTKENAKNVSLSRKVLARALGTSIAVLPEVKSEVAQGGDLYLMCSDGLSDLVPHVRIQEITTSSLSLATIGETLINEAKVSGGHDNITLLLMRLE